MLGLVPEARLKVVGWGTPSAVNVARVSWLVWYAMVGRVVDADPLGSVPAMKRHMFAHNPSAATTTRSVTRNIY
jgi:hypothetical protein